MRKMRQELNNIGLDEIEIMIRIQCGESKNVQKWGTQFWKLVDEKVTPPEIYIGKNLPKYEEGLMNQKIDSLVKNEIVENYISFYPDEEKFYRYLNIQERE